MKKYHLILILFSIIPVSNSQVITGYDIGFSYSLNFLQGDNAQDFNNYKLNGGVQLFNKLNAAIEVGFMNVQHANYNDVYAQNMNTIKLGALVSYRFLKDFIISPKIAVDGGFFPYSNLNGSYVFMSGFKYSYNDKGTNATFLIDKEEKYGGLFESWKGYFDFQLFLSIKLKQLYIDIGGGFGYVGYSYRDHPDFYSSDSSVHSKNINGFNFAFKLRYIIPSKMSQNK